MGFGLLLCLGVVALSVLAAAGWPAWSRWTPAAVLTGLACWIMAFNWGRHFVMWRRHRRGEPPRFISSAPIISPVLLTAALAIAPIGTLGDRMKWVWAVWLIDEGTWLILATLAILVVPAWRKKYMPSGNGDSARS